MLGRENCELEERERGVCQAPGQTTSGGLSGLCKSGDGQGMRQKVQVQLCAIDFGVAPTPCGRLLPCSSGSLPVSQGNFVKTSKHLKQP